MSEVQTVTMLSLNTREARLDLANQNGTTPEAERARALIRFIHDHNADTIGLCDVSGSYEDDEQLAATLGFETAKYVDLADERIQRPEGAGLIFATNHKAEIEQIRLHNRNGVRAVLEPSNIQIAYNYLDDVSEAVRRQQLADLLKTIDPNLAALLVGDGNTLPHNLEGASRKSKLHHGLFRAAALAINLLPAQAPDSTIGYYQQALREMDKRTITLELERRGFSTADPSRTTTISKLGLRACLDHAYANGHLTATGRVVPTGKLSDHDALLVSAQAATP